MTGSSDRVRREGPWIFARSWWRRSRAASVAEASPGSFDFSVRHRTVGGLRILVGPDHFGEPGLQPESIAPCCRCGNDAVGEVGPVRSHQQPAAFRRQQCRAALWADEHERLCRPADDLGRHAAQHRGPNAPRPRVAMHSTRVGLRRRDGEDHLSGIAVGDDPGLDVDDVGVEPSAIVELVLCGVDVVGGAAHEKHPSGVEARSHRARRPNARVRRTRDPSSGTTIVVMILRTPLLIR
jgi:hypothetical protein